MTANPKSTTKASGWVDHITSFVPKLEDTVECTLGKATVEDIIRKLKRSFGLLAKLSRLDVRKRMV